jgi:hypothetical protein
LARQTSPKTLKLVIFLTQPEIFSWLKTKTIPARHPNSTRLPKEFRDLPIFFARAKKRHSSCYVMQAEE